MNKSKATFFKQLLAGLTVCGFLFPAAMADDRIPFTDITPRQASALIAEKGTCPFFKILDVRTAAEFAAGRIKNAQNIDVQAPDFREKVGKLDGGGVYLVYCRGGVRSANAMSLMKGLGFKEVYNLAGGVLGWQQEKLPLEESSPGQTVQAPPPAPPPDTTPYAWLNGKKNTAIPFRLVGNHIHIDAEINGVLKKDLILDTGMPMPGILFLNEAAVRELNLVYTGQARVGGAGGGLSEAKVATGITMQFGDLRFTEQTAVVKTEIPKAPAASAPNLDVNLNAIGIIGKTFFGRFVVGIDYDRMLITLTEPGDFAYRGTGSAIPIVFESGFPFVDCTARLQNEKVLTLRLVLDVGAAHAVSLVTAAQPGIQPPPTTIDYWSRGIGPELRGKLGRIGDLTLGKYVLKGVLAGFQSEKRMPFEKDGNLGSDFLKHFNLIFDYSRRLLIIEPNSLFGEPFEFGMSGFQAKKTESGDLFITHILPDSPAAGAGLRESDHITEINGRPAGQVSSEDFSKASIREGELLKLTITRGTSRINVELKLRRLI